MPVGGGLPGVFQGADMGVEGASHEEMKLMRVPHVFGVPMAVNDYLMALLARVIKHRGFRIRGSPKQFHFKFVKRDGTWSNLRKREGGLVSNAWRRAFAARHGRVDWGAHLHVADPDGTVAAVGGIHRRCWEQQLQGGQRIIRERRATPPASQQLGRVLRERERKTGPCSPAIFLPCFRVWTCCTWPSSPSWQRPPSHPLPVDNSDH